MSRATLDYKNIWRYSTSSLAEANGSMSPMARQRILRTLSIFRPTFRSISQNLKDVDLVLVEEFFERLLLDYDRVFTSMAIPACLWRRTGEIYRGNKEFAALINVNLDELRDVCPISPI
jgi:hypothetical protein